MNHNNKIMETTRIEFQVEDDYLKTPSGTDYALSTIREIARLHEVVAYYIGFDPNTNVVRFTFKISRAMRPMSHFNYGGIC